MEVTVERLQRAILIVARGMQFHKMPEAIPIIRRLEAEIVKLEAEGDALDYARRILERNAITIADNDNQAALLRLSAGGRQ